MTNNETLKRPGDILTSKFGLKWKVGDEYTIESVDVVDSTFNGRPSQVALFRTDLTDKEGEPITVFSGSSVVVGQALDLITAEEQGTEVFPMRARLVERKSKASQYTYQELE